MNEKLANKEISQCNYEKESLNNREIKNSVRSLLYNIVKEIISDLGLAVIFVVLFKAMVLHSHNRCSTFSNYSFNP